MGLFKFKSAKIINEFNRDVQTIQDNKIWFSDLESLNDPFEKVYATQILDKSDGMNQIVNDFFIPFRTSIDDFYKKVGILSLCRENSNLVMWSHYADNHKGYCIEYDITSNNFDELNFENKDEVFLFNIEYENSPIDYLSLPSNFQFYLRRKSKLWEYEKELRFISSRQGLHNIPDNSIKSIFLGANANNIVKNTLFILCKEKNINLYQTILSANSYELEFKRIL